MNTPFASEANVRAKGHAQVIVSAVVEIHFIANIQAQADRSDVAFESAAGIEDGVDVSGAEAFDGTGERIKGSRTIVEAKVHESPFHRHERMYGKMADLEFGSEHTMEDAEVGAIDRDCASAGVCESLGEHLVEIVGHFAFQLDHLVSGESQASAETCRVCTCLRDR